MTATAIAETNVANVAARVFRAEHGRILATLIGYLGDFQLAEDALQDAFTTALRAWESDGVPGNPGAWLTTAARRKAIDRLRRERTLAQTSAALQTMASIEKRAREAGAAPRVAGGESMDGTTTLGTLGEDRLRLIFTCCH